MQAEHLRVGRRKAEVGSRPGPPPGAASRVAWRGCCSSFRRAWAPPHRRTPDVAAAAPAGRRRPCRSCRRRNAPPAPRRPALPTSMALITSVDVRLQRDRGRQQVGALAQAGQRHRMDAVALLPAAPATTLRQHQPPCQAPCTRTKLAIRSPCCFSVPTIAIIGAIRAARATLPRCAGPAAAAAGRVRTGVALSLIGLDTRRKRRLQRMLPLRDHAALVAPAGRQTPRPGC